MIFVNFKTYKEATGEKAVFLAKICQEVSLESKMEIIPIVSVVDLYRVFLEVKIPLWVQHLDYFPQGQFTGFINLEAVIASGGKGTLLNHAEHRLPPGTISQIIKRVRKVSPSGFKVMVCGRTLGQIEKLKKLKPDFLSYEPPELIGGEISVSQARPEVIERITKRIKDIPIIVGAGIKSKEDVKKSLKLGAKGVLLSSGVVLAKEPKKVLFDLVSGFCS